MFTLVYKGAPHMVISLSEDASNTALDTIAAMMDGGRIELLSTDDDLIAVLKLSNPSASAAEGGAIELNPIAPGTASRQGRVETARIVAATGADLMTCDVGDENSDAVIKLDSTSIPAGSVVTIRSFTLSMP